MEFFPVSRKTLKEHGWLIVSQRFLNFEGRGLPANFLRKCSNGVEAKGFAAPRSISILGIYQRRGFMKNTGFRSWMKSGILTLKKKLALLEGPLFCVICELMS